MQPSLGISGPVIRLIISGGPGAGCTTTGKALGDHLGLPVFDSDAFFHKPTDPPFQEQYTAAERRSLLGAALASAPAWILTGSVATWGLDSFSPTHGVFLDLPAKVRLDRLSLRQNQQFGQRIQPGGDMVQEHESFMEWAAGYESDRGAGRNWTTDLAFLKRHSPRLLAIQEEEPINRILMKILSFLTDSKSPEQAFIA